MLITSYIKAAIRRGEIELSSFFKNPKDPERNFKLCKYALAKSLGVSEIPLELFTEYLLGTEALNKIKTLNSNSKQADSAIKTLNTFFPQLLCMPSSVSTAILDCYFKKLFLAFSKYSIPEAFVKDAIRNENIKLLYYLYKTHPQSFSNIRPKYKTQVESLLPKEEEKNCYVELYNSNIEALYDRYFCLRYLFNGIKINTILTSIFVMNKLSKDILDTILETGGDIIIHQKLWLLSDILAIFLTSFTIFKYVTKNTDLDFELTVLQFCDDVSNNIYQYYCNMRAYLTDDLAYRDQRGL